MNHDDLVRIAHVLAGMVIGGVIGSWACEHTFNPTFAVIAIVIGALSITMLTVANVLLYRDGKRMDRQLDEKIETLRRLMER